MLYCSNCGQPRTEAELARFGDTLVCADCKPVWTQRLMEGGGAPAPFAYAGVGQRLLAAIIDGVILYLITLALQVPLSSAMMGETPPTTFSAALFAVSYGVGLLIGSSYEGVFIYKMQATPGKLIMGMKVVRANGDRLTLLRAYCRYCAKILSAFTLLIGYLMAFFDSERRTLHDRICDTRVTASRS